MTLSLDEIERLYARYGPMVLRRCRSMLGNEEKAVEAMQDVFVKVLSKRDALDASAPSSLLYRTATNHCLNQIRASGRRPESLDGELLEQIACLDDPEERILSIATLERFFKPEKNSTKVMAVLHFVDGMTLEEVALEVGLSVSGVRKRLRLLKQKINLGDRNE